MGRQQHAFQLFLDPVHIVVGEVGDLQVDEEWASGLLLRSRDMTSLRYQVEQGNQIEDARQYGGVGFG